MARTADTTPIHDNKIIADLLTQIERIQLLPAILVGVTRPRTCSRSGNWGDGRNEWEQRMREETELGEGG